jgi:CarD family transcriptional regulator
MTKPAPFKRGNEGAAFAVGDTVVHPRHGAGRVVSQRRRRMLGAAARDYLEIELDDAALRIMVPCDTARSVGLRAVVGKRQMQLIVDVLEGDREVDPASWSARQRHYREKLKGGDVLELAAVIRDLALRDADSGLPRTDRDVYERSRQLLASELRHALGVDADRATAYIDEHVAARPLAAGSGSRCGVRGRAA